MVTDFIVTADGFSLVRQYEDKFNGSIRIDEPSGELLILDIGNKSFRIADSSLDDFKETFIQSLESGKNLLLEKNKGNEINYEAGVVY